jgi:cell wall-associated NlpC family hydrolase
MKGLITLLLLFSSNLCWSQEITKSDSVVLNKECIQDITQVVDSAINYGKSFIGLAYKYGGTSTSGFDCSGFIKHIFNKYGLILPHSSRDYANIGDTISLKEIKKGDILLFKGSNLKSKRIGHVSIVVEVAENEILMLHSCRRGVLIENYLDSDFYLKRFVGVRRLNKMQHFRLHPGADFDSAQGPAPTLQGNKTGG